MRWTESETGGLDPARNVEPRLVEAKSFDGQIVSGFLYQPDPTKFPGKRPLILDIHGGPEGQSQPSYRGAAGLIAAEMKEHGGVIAAADAIEESLAR